MTVLRSYAKVIEERSAARKVACFSAEFIRRRRVQHGIRFDAGTRMAQDGSERHIFDVPAAQEIIAKIPERRRGRIYELIGPVIMLAKDAGSFIGGSVVVPDGAPVALIA